jgi:hypothetical protein
MIKLFPYQSAHWRSTLFVVGVAVAATGCSKRDRDSAGAPPAVAPADVVMQPAPKAAPHGGHDPAHGGLVLMDAHDHHAELVLDTKGGKHRVYISDGARAALPASTFDEVHLSVARPEGAIEKLAITKAADDTHWQAAGTPVPATRAKVSLSYGKGGKPIYQVELPVEYVLTGKMPDDPAPSTPSEHAHASPHGGVVSTTSNGHIELVANRSGRFQVWLLDAKLAARPTAGVTVKVKVGNGSAVSAAESGDHFEAKGEAFSSGHVSATVTAEAAGKTETAQFKLHLENAASGHGSGHAGH